MIGLRKTSRLFNLFDKVADDRIFCYEKVTLSADDIILHELQLPASKLSIQGYVLFAKRGFYFYTKERKGLFSFREHLTLLHDFDITSFECIDDSIIQVSYKSLRHYSASYRLNFHKNARKLCAAMNISLRTQRILEAAVTA